jgi:hypothetical protein
MNQVPISLRGGELYLLQPPGTVSACGMWESCSLHFVPLTSHEHQQGNHEPHPSPPQGIFTRTGYWRCRSTRTYS